VALDEQREADAGGETEAVGDAQDEDEKRRDVRERHSRRDEEDEIERTIAELRKQETNEEDAHRITPPDSQTQPAAAQVEQTR